MGRLLVLRRASWSLPKDEQVFDTTLFVLSNIEGRNKDIRFCSRSCVLKIRPNFLTQQELDKWDSPHWGGFYLGILLSKHVDVS